MALLVCICFPATAEEPPSDPETPQAIAESKPAAEAEASAEAGGEFKSPPGFRSKKHGDLILYCRRESVLGSRFKAEKCYDQAGVEEIMRAEHESKDLVDKIRNCGVGSCPGG